MMWLILLVVGLATAENQLQLADSIVSTEQECSRLYKLNTNWNANNFNDQAVLLVDLFFLCEDSLAEDKYKYLDRNHIDLSQFPEDKFPVLTSKGEVLVLKPPARSNENVGSMQEKVTDFLNKVGGINKLANAQSKLGQEIVDQQVDCELLGLEVLSHADDEALVIQHTTCMNKLNCMKEKFMTEHSLDLATHQDFFPILYKGRGTMLNSPPKSTGESLCVSPVHPDVYKKDLQKWKYFTGKVQTVKKTTAENLKAFERSGNELIRKLKKMGPGPLLTQEQMDKLMEDVNWVTTENDGLESTSETIQKYGSKILDKMAELETEAMEKNKKKMERMNKMVNHPGESIDDSTSEDDDPFEQFAANKMKTAVKKTMKTVGDAETHVKATSAAAIEEIKDKLTSANDAGKLAAATLKEDTSSLLQKLKPNKKNKPDAKSSEEKENDSEEHNRGTLGQLAKRVAHSEYLTRNLNNLEQSVLDKFVTKMDETYAEGDGMLSDRHIAELLTTLKNDIKEKSESIHIDKEEIKQVAIVLKTVLHSILNAGKNGVGPAKGMTAEEIDDAKALVNELVDFTTQDLEADEEEDQETESSHQLTSPTTEEDKVVTEKEEEVDVAELPSQDIPKHLPSEVNDEKTLENLMEDLKIPRVSLPAITYPVKEVPNPDLSATAEKVSTQDESNK